MSVPTSVTELIDHIPTRFHETHRRELPGKLVAPAGTRPEVAALRSTLAKLFDDLARHVHLEEEVLFPMFEVRPGS